MMGYHEKTVIFTVNEFKKCLLSKVLTLDRIRIKILFDEQYKLHNLMYEDLTDPAFEI